nr:MAG TPA: hypothetical protein [Caudoviricetes sp.]
MDKRARNLWYNASKGGDGTILYNHSEIVELARLGYTSS